VALTVIQKTSAGGAWLPFPPGFETQQRLSSRSSAGNCSSALARTNYDLLPITARQAPNTPPTPPAPESRRILALCTGKRDPVEARPSAKLPAADRRKISDRRNCYTRNL
jgi:hypothetical protein